jgi:hypothetical protein
MRIKKASDSNDAHANQETQKPLKVKIDALAWEFNSWVVGTRAFLDVISQAISESESAEDKLRERAQSEGWEADDYFAEDSVLRENFEHWLPRLSSYAVIILLHSLVETQLVRCARRMRKDQTLSLDVKELRGSAISRAKMYLTKVANLNVGTDPGWHELSNLQDIRDILVHRRGRIEEDSEHKKVLQRLLKQYPKDITLSPALSHGFVDGNQQEILITFKLCLHFLNEIDAFFKRLFKLAGFQESPVRISDDDD